MATEIAKLIAIIGADDSQLDEGLSRADQKIERAGRQMARRAGEQMQSVGRTLSLAVTAPLVAAGAGLVKVGMEFEQTLNVFRATANLTGEQMKEVSALARELGADLSLPNTSAKDATEAMLEMSKAGMGLQDVMESARGVLQLSAAAQIDNARAAEITANTLNAFGLKGAEAGRVADLLAAAAKSSSGEITDMADALQMSAAVFAASEVPIEDLVTAIGLMANAGIQGSDAGTSLKVMLMALTAPSKKAREQMEEMGLRVYDAAGNLHSMREIVAQFSKALSGMTQEQRVTALATIFGTDAVRAANVVLAQGVEAFDAMKGAVTEEGVAADLAAAQNAGLKGALDGLKSALQTLATSEAALALLKILAGLVRLAALALNLFGKLPAVMQYAAVGVAVLAAAAGPLLYALGGIVKMLPEIRAIAAAIGALGVVGGIRATLAGTAPAGAAAAGGGFGVGAGWTWASKRAALAGLGLGRLGGAARGLRGGLLGMAGYMGLGFLPEGGLGGLVKHTSQGAISGAGYAGLAGALLGTVAPGAGNVVGGAAGLLGGALVGGGYGLYQGIRGWHQPARATQAVRTAQSAQAQQAPQAARAAQAAQAQAAQAAALGPAAPAMRPAAPMVPPGPAELGSSVPQEFSAGVSPQRAMAAAVEQSLRIQRERAMAAAAARQAALAGQAAAMRYEPVARLARSAQEMARMEPATRTSPMPMPGKAAPGPQAPAARAQGGGIQLVFNIAASSPEEIRRQVDARLGEVLRRLFPAPAY